AVLELLANDPFRWQTHPVAIKGERALEIAHTQGENFDAWSHRPSPCVGSGQTDICSPRGGKSPATPRCRQPSGPGPATVEGQLRPSGLPEPHPVIPRVPYAVDGLAVIGVTGRPHPQPDHVARVVYCLGITDALDRPAAILGGAGAGAAGIAVVIAARAAEE